MLLLILGLYASVGLIFSAFLQTQIRDKLHSDLQEKGLFIAKELAKASVDPILMHSPLLLKMVLQEFRESDPDVAYIYIRATDGRVLAHTFSNGFPEDFLKFPVPLPDGQDFQLKHYRMDGNIVGDFAVEILSGQLGVAHVGMSEALILQDIRTLTWSLQGLLLLLSLAGGAIAIAVASTITRPLRVLTRAVGSIGQGDMADIVEPKTGSAEVQHLTQAFNSMTRRLAVYHAEIIRSQEELEKEIGEQRQTERALRRSEEMFRGLSENSTDFIIRFDRNLNLLYANQAFLTYIGKPMEQIFGKDLQSAGFEPQERSRIEQYLSRVFETGKLQQWEEENVRSTGNSYLDWRVSPERAEGKHTESVLAVCRDISMKKKMEHEMLRVQNLESLGTLAGGIAHDFNNLLTMVFGNIDLALMHVDRQTDIASWLREAAKAAEQAQHLTGQLLTFSKGGAPVKNTGPIDVTLGNAVILALSGSNVSNHITIPSDLWPLEFDRGQMTQVFSNITLNAVQAMPGGGSLVVVARNENLATDNPLPLPAGPYVCIKFRDTGHGIEPDILPRVFDPYFTTKGMTTHRGAGLGLSICHSIVQRHAGHIGIESAPGRGTEVTLYLPASPEALPASPDDEQQQPQSTSPLRRVLLMDDEAGVAAVGRTLLETLGWNTAWAVNGEEAIRKYRESLELGTPYDVVLLDLTVKGGLGGRETVAELLAIDPKVHTVVASGYANDDVMTHYWNYGFGAAVKKPYTIESLSHAIQQAMNNHCNGKPQH